MITKDKFYKGTFGRRKRVNTEHPVSIFLRQNKKNAYKAEEISKKTKLNINTVRSALSKLVKKRRIEHKTPYFIWKERNQSRKYKKSRRLKKR